MEFVIGSRVKIVKDNLGDGSLENNWREYIDTYGTVVLHDEISDNQYEVKCDLDGKMLFFSEDELEHSDEDQFASLPSIEFCRPEVIEFARIMEHKLRQNDHKGGWKDCDSDEIYIYMEEEVREVADALQMLQLSLHNGDSSDRVNALRFELACECADAANYSMMICDIHDGLNLDGVK